MEDALISPAGFMILSGAGLINAEEETIYVHSTEQTKDVVVAGDVVTIKLTEKPYTKSDEDLIYVMALDDNGEVATEPYIATFTAPKEEPADGKYAITIALGDTAASVNGRQYFAVNDTDHPFKTDSVVLVDYYVARTSGAQQIDITPDKFGGNYYLEASTLFRTTDGVDMPAEFIIPNCKIQSNFTFTMASSGDPSSFTFTMDAFPDYTRFNQTKKVLAAIQIVDEGTGSNALRRASTIANKTHREDPTSGAIVEIKST